MTEQQERRDFDRRHASDAIELVVLTGDRTSGAGKAGGEVLWTPSATILGSVDATGAAVLENGRLSWLATDAQSGSWIHDLKPLTQYRVQVRRATPDPAEYKKHGMPVPDLSRHFALDAVLERDVHLPVLDARLAEWTRPRILTTDIVELELDRSIGHFAGPVDWCGADVEVMLDIDDDALEGAETCEVALSRLRTFVQALEATDSAWRAFAAAKLTALANDWQADEDGAEDVAPITEDSFAGRIGLSELAIAADGSATPYYHDDEMFWGHVILLDVEVDGTITDAYIAG